MGQQVCLMNPKNLKQRVAVGFISGFAGFKKFHFNTIPDGWLKVDVKDATAPSANLMYPHPAANQYEVKDVVGGNTLWDEKFVKRAWSVHFWGFLMHKPSALFLAIPVQVGDGTKPNLFFCTDIEDHRTHTVHVLYEKLIAVR
jgi:hypothetical protein